MNLEAIKLYLGAGNKKSEKLISDRYAFIWVGIPKAAMTSILAALHDGNDRRFGTGLCYEELRTIMKKNPEYNNYFKFAFVRNPWSRTVSCYINKIRKGPVADRDFLKNHIGLRPDISFDDFVRYLVKGHGRYDKFSDRHWLSQHKFITDKKGNILVDYIGKMEHIDSDFAVIREKTGLPEIVLPKYNTRFDWGLEKTSDDAPDPFFYRSYFNDYTRELIGGRYKKDIELFGYEF